MEIICQSKLKITVDKLPPGQAATVRCPRCSAKISIPASNGSDADGAFEDLFVFGEDEGDGYEATEKPFDFIEEEGKSSLVAEPDALIHNEIRPTLDIPEYHVTEVSNSREALKKGATTITIS
jgi:hypothetical protein